MLSFLNIDNFFKKHIKLIILYILLMVKLITQLMSFNFSDLSEELTLTITLINEFLID